METYSYKILIEHLDLIKHVVNYFTAYDCNQSYFKIIEQKGIEWVNKQGKTRDAALISTGYLSISDFINLQNELKLIQKGIPLLIVESTVKTLEKHRVILPFPRSGADYFDKRYKSNGEYTKFLCRRNLMLNILLGWRYIIEHSQNAVFKIVIKDNNGEFSIGTGFYFAVVNDNGIKALIVTNKHVLEDASEIKVYSNDEREVNYKSIVLDEKRDLGFLILKSQLILNTLHFNTEVEVLSDILTIGYPAVPMTKEAYQIYHKGEINSFVEDYQGNKLFLFSAKTTSGNSGSPIIDKYGMVVGIVCEELFEKNAFYEKGKLPYYAGIPASEIIKSANEYVIV